LLVGTDEDPQDLAKQRDAFETNGAIGFDDTMSLVGHAVSILGAPVSDEVTPVPLESLNTPVAAINIGLETFFDSLTDQGAAAVQVDWRPPAGGDERLMDILSKMQSSG
jgi:FdrA protein